MTFPFSSNVTIKALLVAVLTAVGLLSASIAAAEPASSGEFTAAFKSWGKKSLEGSWAIEQHGDKLLLKLGSNFKAKSAPDIKVFLSPKVAGEIDGSNATAGSLFVKQITDFEGAMTIEIPAGTNLSDYRTLVLHCDEYSKLWGTSGL